MSIINILDMRLISNNPAQFSDTFQFEIQFESMEALSDGACCSIAPHVPLTEGRAGVEDYIHRGGRRL